MTTLLVAGATGAAGSVVVPKARAAGMAVIPHVRPKTAEKHPLGKDPEALICDLTDAAALDAAMARTDVIACLVGTTKKRFAQGDTYESSDHAPVIHLLESSKRAPKGPRHFILLSSVGARQGWGYLGWKWRAEQAVRESGVPFTILRPSMFDDRGAGAQPSDGKPRRPPPLFSALTRAIGYLPGFSDFAERLLPISIDDLAAAIVRVAKERAPIGAVLEGRGLREMIR